MRSSWIPSPHATTAENSRPFDEWIVDSRMGLSASPAKSLLSGMAGSFTQKKGRVLPCEGGGQLGTERPVSIGSTAVEHR